MAYSCKDMDVPGKLEIQGWCVVFTTRSLTYRGKFVFLLNVLSAESLTQVKHRLDVVKKSLTRLMVRELQMKTSKVLRCLEKLATFLLVRVKKHGKGQFGKRNYRELPREGRK